MWEMDVGGGIRTDFYCAGAQRGNSPSPSVRPFWHAVGHGIHQQKHKISHFLKKIICVNRTLFTVCKELFFPGLFKGKFGESQAKLTRLIGQASFLLSPCGHEKLLRVSPLAPSLAEVREQGERTLTFTYTREKKMRENSVWRRRARCFNFLTW